MWSHGASFLAHPKNPHTNLQTNLSLLLTQVKALLKFDENWSNPSTIIALTRFEDWTLNMTHEHENYLQPICLDCSRLAPTKFEDWQSNPSQPSSHWCQTYVTVWWDLFGQCPDINWCECMTEWCIARRKVLWNLILTKTQHISIIVINMMSRLLKVS